MGRRGRAARPTPATGCRGWAARSWPFKEHQAALADLWAQALAEAGDEPELRRHLRRHVRDVHEYVAGVVVRAQKAGAIPRERDAEAEAWIFLAVGLARDRRRPARLHRRPGSRADPRVATELADGQQVEGPGCGSRGLHRFRPTASRFPEPALRRDRLRNLSRVSAARPPFPPVFPAAAVPKWHDYYSRVQFCQVVK